MCDYGMSPGRPLRIMALLILVFSSPSMIALKTQGRSGLWAVWLADRVHKNEGQENPVRVTDEFTFGKLMPAWGWQRLLVLWLRVLHIGLYFSLLAAF